MHIERVQVEEGFLDGLDVTLVPGLNVVIGSRGTGKTSLIELIRFCLGVRGYTPETDKRSHEHAVSVLGAGQVTVTLSDGMQKITVTRTASDVAPRASGGFAVPIIFSQTEIETVGLQDSGRLELLDGFAGDRRRSDAAQLEAASVVRSLTAEGEVLRREVDQFRIQISGLPALEQQIKELAPSEQQLAKVSSDAAEKKKKLDELASTIASSSVAATAIDRFKQGLARWRASIAAALQTAPNEERWPAAGGKDPLNAAREYLQRARATRRGAQRLGACRG
jgi:chromosome segregation ATPase